MTAPEPHLERTHAAEDVAVLAGIAHDVRTPLTRLIAMCESAEPGESHLQARMLREVRLLEGLIGELFDRLHAQHLATPRRESISVYDLTSDTIAGLRPGAAARAIHVEGTAPRDLVLTADPSSLRRALDNLATNAVRHTASGGLVHIRAYEHHDSLAIEVTDGCGGIDPHVMTNVFKAGFIGADSLRERAPRAGLGLAIVSHIVRAHGGKVCVENIDRGCRFRIVLPLQMSADEPKPSLKGEEQATG